MLDEIKNIIKKSLPAEVGEQLRLRLEQADRLERELRETKESHERIREANVKQAEEIAGIRTLLAKSGDLAKREAEVTKRENVLEVTLAKDEAMQAEKRADEIKDLVAIVFGKVANVRKTVTEHAQVPVPGTQGTYPSVLNVDKTVTEETEHS